MPENGRNYFTSSKKPGFFKKRHIKIFGKVKKSLKKPLKLIKSSHNPIIAPTEENNWERFQVFNPGAIYLEQKVHFVYRALGDDYISRFGYASSTDGFLVNYRHHKPIYDHSTTSLPYTFYSSASGGSWGGAEDPRLTRVGEEDTIYMTYTATEGGLRMALSSIKVEDFLQRNWRWSRPKLISPPGEVHKNWVIFSEKINGKYAVLTSITPEIQITYLDSLDFEEDEFIESYYHSIDRGTWDSWIRGAGPPPLKVDEGWLLFYHGMDKRDPGKYKVGVLLLDKSNPEKILEKMEYPVLEPSEYYENNGFKCGVVYASGAIVKSGELMIYYGGSDSYVCVAHTNLEKFMSELKRGRKPEFEKQLVRDIYV